MPRISDLSHKALHTLQLLGRMTEAHEEVRRELISNGLAEVQGDHLAITAAGRAFIENASVKDAVPALQAVEILVLENLREPRANDCFDAIVLHRLKERGYVLRSGDGWRLTLYGEAELDRLQTKATTSVTSASQRDPNRNAPDIGGGREDQIETG